jgi:hypothetical protein
MQRNWKEKNVDLAQLITRIGDFFKMKDFEAVRGEIPTGYQILARGSPYFKIGGEVSVTVEGKPDDFTVGFEFCTDKKKSDFPHSIFLESMIIGGYFLSKRLKSEEAWLNLKKEFWRHVENTVLQLGNSMRNSAHSEEAIRKVTQDKGIITAESRVEAEVETEKDNPKKTRKSRMVR